MSPKSDGLRLLLRSAGWRDLLLYVEDQAKEEYERFSSLARQTVLDDSARKDALVVFGRYQAMSDLKDTLNNIGKR